MDDDEDGYGEYHEHAACLPCWRKMRGDPNLEPGITHRISDSWCCWCGVEAEVIHLYEGPAKCLYPGGTTTPCAAP